MYMIEYWFLRKRSMYQKIPWNCTRFGAAFTKMTSIWSYLFIAWFLPIDKDVFLPNDSCSIGYIKFKSLQVQLDCHIQEKFCSKYYIDSSTEIISIPESNSVTSFSRIFHVILAVFIKDLKRSWTGNHFDTFGNLGSHWEVQKPSRHFCVFFTSF